MCYVYMLQRRTEGIVRGERPQLAPCLLAEYHDIIFDILCIEIYFVVTKHFLFCFSTVEYIFLQTSAQIFRFWNPFRDIFKETTSGNTGKVMDCRP